MGVFSQVLSLFETRMPSIEGPLPITSARVVEWLSGPPASTGARINSDTALRISAVWDCIDLVSRDIARTPLQVYFKTAAGRDTSYNHRLYALLHDSPNPYMTAFTFKQTLQAHKMLRGNAYAYIERDDRGQIIGLWPLRPDRMSPPVMSQSDSPTLLYTYHLPSGEARALTQSEVLHLRGLGTEGIVGYSPIELHRETLAAAMAYREYGNRFFGNNSRPGGVLQVDKRLSPEAKENLVRGWEMAHKGLETAHRVAVLEEGIKWQQIGVSQEDAQYLESMKFTRTETASLWHVPAHKINEMTDATYSNIEEQDADYENSTLDAEYVNWEQQCNLQLLLPSEKGKYYLEYLRLALIRTSVEKRGIWYEKAWWMTPNEKRRLENMNDLPGLDEIFVPNNNLVPLSMVGQQQPQSTVVRQLSFDDKGRVVGSREWNVNGIEVERAS